MVLLAIGTVTGASAAAAASLSSNFSRSLSFSRTQTLSPHTASLRFSATSLAIAAPVTVVDALPSLVYCGRGDKKTAKGKRSGHFFENCRSRNKKRGRGPPRAPMPPSPQRRTNLMIGRKLRSISTSHSSPGLDEE